LAVLDEIEHLAPPHAALVLDQVLGFDTTGPVELTPGELRAAVKRAAIIVDAYAARKRHEAAKRDTGVRMRPGVDGMAQLVLHAPATDVATALACIRGRATAMTFDDPDLTSGQKDVAALLHALGCDRVGVQAVLECPVEKAVDLHALSRAGVWSVDVRMPVAVALGLSDHPAVLAGYGPIGADQARALLPQADLVRACVDATTGEVLAVEQPIRRKTWQGAGSSSTTTDDAAADVAAGSTARARALRGALLRMATSTGTIPDLHTDGYVPSQALGRLVDLRDVTSTFPGDSTPAGRTDRDHRTPWPLGPTDGPNLQNLTRRWHRAKQNGWNSHLEPDGTITWTSPTRGVYKRKPQRTIPPQIPPGAQLPDLDA
ncbi:MAG: hypothetical protein JWM62_3194, partial [Frankiales bacterium]|nr:hypothetical protein [Frankiales bacterium]